MGGRVGGVGGKGNDGLDDLTSAYNLLYAFSVFIPSRIIRTGNLYVSVQ